MDEREELKQELESELQWAKHRQKMLNIIDEKLQRMRQLAKQGNLTSRELGVLNDRLNNLVMQIKATDSESIRIEDGKILE